ncbi:MAG: hypothetical protein ACRDRX_11445 [Pseudonocardiaceae bacterium]
MDTITPSVPDDEFDLDVQFVESDLEVATGDTDDCERTDDECENTRGCE